MAKKGAASDDDILKNGLRALATADGPRRLVGKGDHQAVFGNTAPEKRAAAACREGEPPLVTVHGAAKKETATLTAAGFDRITDSIPEDRLGPVAKAVAEGLPAGERVAFLQRVVGSAPVAVADLLPMLETAVAEEQAEREAEAARQAKRRAAEAASLEALERWRTLVEARRQERIAGLKRELLAEGGEADELPRPAGGSSTARPQTKEDLVFRRDVASQLVSSWRATWEPDRPEIRDFVESAIWNVRGLRMVGEVNEVTAFDGRHHEGGPGVFTGDTVRVVRPGWILEEGDDAEYVVQKAVVERRG